MNLIELFSISANTAMLVCPQTPKTCLTPLSSRYFTNCLETSSFMLSSVRVLRITPNRGLLRPGICSKPPPSSPRPLAGKGAKDEAGNVNGSLPDERVGKVDSRGDP